MAVGLWAAQTTRDENQATGSAMPSAVRESQGSPDPRGEVHFARGPSQSVADGGDAVTETAAADAVPESPRCEVIDGIPARPEVGDLEIEIDARGQVKALLTVSYVQRLTRDAGFLFGGVTEDFGFHSSQRVTQSRVTVRDCSPRDEYDDTRPGWITVETDDGRGSAAPWPEDGGKVRLRPVRPTTVRGHLLFDGGNVGHAWVSLRNFSTEQAYAGAFELEFFSEESGETELTAHEPLRGGTLQLAAEPIVVRYSPGATVDLGELKMEFRPTLPSGKVGIGWGSEKGPPVVEFVVEESPAEKAGIKVGDVVAEVDGAAVESIPEAMKLIPGAPGSAVRIKIRRGTDYLLFAIVRMAGQ